ncbi:MAG: DsbA family protein [Myxococcales bacterium]|nr:DsbA family protein [Myxococcales bacterium]
MNGVPIRGALPFPAMQKVIDDEVKLAEGLLKDGVKRKDVYAEVLKREGGKSLGGGEDGAAPAGPVDIEIGRAPTTGKKNAPVEVVVYSDFQCPFCSRVNPSIAKIKEDYKDKVLVAFKHYPLSFHQDAKPAAIASLAAHKQGKFWEMHDKLFANQGALKEADLEKYAKEMGLDMPKFQADMKDPALAKWVDEDMAEGTKVGVRGTPATFINGRIVSGAQPYEAFKAIIEEELGKS